MIAKKLNIVKRIARDVYRSLGSGHPEVVYDRAMQVGLRLAKIKYENQKVVELTYKNHYVGEGYPDIVINFGADKAVIELKAIGGTMGPAEEQQLKTYMKILRIKRGLLINFQQPMRAGKSQIEIREVHLS